MFSDVLVRPELAGFIEELAMATEASPRTAERWWLGWQVTSRLGEARLTG
jgi:hypothetical protein